MQTRLSLQSRIAATMLLLTALAGVVFGIWTRISDDRMASSLTRELLTAELDHYENLLAIDAAAPPLSSANLRIYGAAQRALLPAAIAALPPGVHYPIRVDGRHYHVLVRDGPHGRLVITYDITSHDRQQRLATLVMVLGLMALLIMTAWAAFGVSNRLVSPVNALARRVSAIEPGRRHTPFSPEFAATELEPIAASVDTLLDRLEGFVAREHSFTETASHELRTPLAVVQGAVEIVAEQTRSQPQTQKAVARIQRAVREMTDYTQALLILAREGADPVADGARCDVAQVLERVAEDLQLISPGTTIRVARTASEPVRVNAPDSVVAMVIANLLRNAIQHGSGGAVQCRLADRTLSVANAGEIDPAVRTHLFERRVTTSAAGHGMGLDIAARLCDRYGWQVDLASEGGRTVATIMF
jgi:signal transduction histidine kinase